MRLISLFKITLLSVTVAGCVSIPGQQQVAGYTGHGKLDTLGSTGSKCDTSKVSQHAPTGVASDSSLDPNRISVLNWNIYKGSRENWSKDFIQFSDQKNIVLLQEAHTGDDLKTMLTNNKFSWSMNTAFYRNGTGYGVMTASSISPLYTCGQHVAEPIIRVPKTALISYFRVAGQDELLLVANVHSINFSLGTGAYREQIDKLYNVMKHHDGPIVLAGDFNTWSDERMLIVEELAYKLSLDSLEYTTHNRTLVFGNALDHVFYRGLEPLEYDAWHVTSSDHNPIRVSFKIAADEQLAYSKND